MIICHGLLRILRYFIRRLPDDNYDLLTARPSPRWTSRKARRRLGPRCCFCHLLTLRRVLITLSALLVIAILAQGVPPSFGDIRTFERRLPQHDLSDLTYRDVRYIRFSNYAWGLGLNNVLQEALLMSYIAHEAQRSYVFEDYVWSRTPLPYTIYDFALRPARIPLNAFIAGPTSGGPTAYGPRAVSAEFWEKVCPKERRHIISQFELSHEEGSVIVDWWVDRLKSVQDLCVEVDSKVFDFYFFGSRRILSLLPGLSASPIMQQFAWSPLVYATMMRNLPVLQSHSAPDLLSIASSNTPSSKASERGTAFPGLVAVHIRRGDYSHHCLHLARFRSTYVGFNLMPGLPDTFDPDPPPPPPSHSSTETEDAARKAHYFLHCLPSVPQIVARLRTIRQEHAVRGGQRLTQVYVLSNGWGWWLAGLARALRLDGWEDVRSSADMRLGRKERWVAMAVDMAVAERAEVFVGNGFSSLSANLVILRMARGLDITTTRFL